MEREVNSRLYRVLNRMLRFVFFLKVMGSRVVLNIIKIVFFFNLLLFCNVVNRLKKDKSGSREDFVYSFEFG